MNDLTNLTIESILEAREILKKPVPPRFIVTSYAAESSFRNVNIASLGVSVFGMTGPTLIGMEIISHPGIEGDIFFLLRTREEVNDLIKQLDQLRLLRKNPMSWNHILYSLYFSGFQPKMLKR